ncbi:hypothetical protein H2199_003951 [Coniosporium tulheliwenetii]|uniref:Uncharacterized protein n=1 Tax=Coniosporium tulheliwenetii TaxID=3383036 RepID=A0ACC2Z8H2_9PEZI|nr:hypothetical protein H2199_003951 [Cladosporium sp. JES 115]
MSVSERADNPWPHNQYIGQRAEGYATQIVGNVGTLYSSSKEVTAQDCLAALFLTDPLVDRSNLIDKKGTRVGGTCEWIRQNGTYLSWLCSASQLLWLSGGPGKGKTMLSIFLAEELEQTARQSQDAIFIQYFCDNKDEKRNTAVAIIRGLVYQLLQKREKLISHILPTFKVQKEKLFTDSSFGALWTCFESMVRDPSLGVVYCVMDGLDECNEASLEVLLKRLRALFSPNANLSSACHLNLIAVSREQPDFVARELSGFPRIRLDPDADSDVNSDIGKFITVKVGELSRYRNYPPQLRSRVEDVFHKRAEGTFLWVGIVAKELEKYTCDEVKDALDSFPPGLDELYARMLLQIPSRRRETTAKILRWVVIAVRPLTLLELSTAIGITAEASSGLSCEEVMCTQVRNCGHLLTMTDTPTGQEVGLVHQSAKDYLLRETRDPIAELESFRIKKEAANFEVALKCLTYLQEGALADGVVDLLEDRQRTKAFPLLSYAVLHWPEHARCLSDPRLDIFDLSLPFYADRSPVRETWLETYWAAKEYGAPPGSFSVLHVASYCDIVPLAERLLCRRRWQQYVKLSVNKKDSRGRTALHWAASRGNEVMVRLLLEEGADLHAKDEDGRTALHEAARSGKEAVVRLLLEEGADLHAKDKDGRTALHEAARSGKEAVVRLLLEKGANPDAKNKGGETVLYEAASCMNNTASLEKEAVVRLLLEKGADPDAKTQYGGTVLYEAVAYGGTVLHWVARLGDEAVDGAARGGEVREGGGGAAAAREGADLHAKDKDGRTALHEAASWGKVAVVRLLVEEGAVVRLLLEKGADLHAKDKDGRTALHEAARSEKEAVVRLLLEKGADLHAKDKDGRTALHEAARSEKEAVVRLLLEKGADLHAKDKDGKTALHEAARSEKEAVVRLLLEKGADLHAKDKDGRTALHEAASWGKEAVDKDGRTALHEAARSGKEAARSGKEAVVRLLLEEGADLHAKDKDGKTALHLVASWRNEAVVPRSGMTDRVSVRKAMSSRRVAMRRANEAVVRLLVEKGADIHAKDKDGKTALHEAARSGNEAVVQLLREAEEGRRVG